MTTIGLPAGPIIPWCLGAVNLTTCPDQNASYSGVDWTTICCDGTISDTTRILADGGVNKTLDIFDLLCCGGDPLGGFDMTSCSSTITPTPLASLAATNTQNAMAWIDSRVGLTWSPYCVWLGSSTSVLKTTVTVSTFSSKDLSASTSSMTPASTRGTSQVSGTASSAAYNTPTPTSGGTRGALREWKQPAVLGLMAHGVFLYAAG